MERADHHDEIRDRGVVEALEAAVKSLDLALDAFIEKGLEEGLRGQIMNARAKCQRSLAEVK